MEECRTEQKQELQGFQKERVIARKVPTRE